MWLVKGKAAPPVVGMLEIGNGTGAPQVIGCGACDVTWLAKSSSVCWLCGGAGAPFAVVYRNVTDKLQL